MAGKVGERTRVILTFFSYEYEDNIFFLFELMHDFLRTLKNIYKHLKNQFKYILNH